MSAAPPEVETGLRAAGRNRLIEAMESVELGFSYVCRRCDVWGRVPPGVGRRCWLCDGADRLERR